TRFMMISLRKLPVSHIRLCFYRFIPIACAGIFGIGTRHVRRIAFSLHLPPVGDLDQRVHEHIGWPTMRAPRLSAAYSRVRLIASALHGTEWREDHHRDRTGDARTAVAIAMTAEEHPELRQH
ncbi:MAG: hypothetical protein ACXVG9_11890, partial [Terriglobales bacterium]